MCRIWLLRDTGRKNAHSECFRFAKPKASQDCLMENLKHSEISVGCTQTVNIYETYTPLQSLREKPLMVRANLQWEDSGML